LQISGLAMRAPLAVVGSGNRLTDSGHHRRFAGLKGSCAISGSKSEMPQTASHSAAGDTLILGRAEGIFSS